MMNLQAYGRTMEQAHTAATLRSLGETISIDGFEAHAATVGQLAATALRRHPNWVSASVLADATASSVARLRALSHVTADWDHRMSASATTHEIVTITPALERDAATSLALASSDVATNRSASAGDLPNSTWRAISRRRRVA